MLNLIFYEKNNYMIVFSMFIKYHNEDNMSETWLTGFIILSFIYIYIYCSSEILRY